MPSTGFLNLELPTVGGSEDEWGDILNATLNGMDDAFQSLVDAANYGAASGVDTIAVTLDPSPSAYVAGLEVRFKAAGDNTTGPTLDVNGLGAKAIKYSDGSSLPAGALVSGVIYTAGYNGTEFVIPSTTGPASAAETLAGTAPKLLTAVGFAGNKSLAANGYYQFPGGFTVQWGTYASAVSSESTVSVSFPIGFANACVYADMVPVNATASSGNDGFYQQVSKSTTGASFRAQDVGGSLATSNWFALGY